MRSAWLLAAGALLAACGKTEPRGAGTTPSGSAGPLVFAPQAAIAVSLTLAKDGPTARTSPIGANYRPQVRFAGSLDERTCAVELPATTPAIAPGETARATLRCELEVRVDRAQRELVVLEGGKQVGHGTVQLP